MKRLLIPILVFGWFLLQNVLSTSKCFSQAIEGSNLLKKNLDLANIKTWPTLGYFPKISKDGAYFMYEILNSPSGSSTLVIRSTKGNWEKKIISIGNEFGFGKVHFSSDSKRLVYQKEDSLIFLTPGSTSPYDKIISNVYDFYLPDTENWLIYRSKSPKDQATIYYFKTGKELALPTNKAFWFDRNGTSLLIKTEEDSSDVIVRALKFLDINKGTVTTIWSDSLDCGDVVFSKDGLKVAFVVNKPFMTNNVQTGNKQIEKAIWFYKKGMTAVNLKVNSYLLNKDYDIVGRLKFIENSDWLVFDIQKKMNLLQPDENAVNVKIWSYKDKILLPDQARILDDDGPKVYKTAINLISNTVMPIENDNDFLSYGPVGDYAIVKGESFVDETWWKQTPPHPTILLSLKDGKKRIIKNESSSLSDFSFSPDRKWLIYYDKQNFSFFSCNLKSGKVRNVTKSIPESFQNEYGLEGTGQPVSGVVAWILEDNSFILYDNYDIWRIDPSGVGNPINITNSYGKKNKLKLRLVYSHDVQFGVSKSIISLSDSLLIVAFSPENKYNGFFRKVLNESGNPQMLFMGPYTFCLTKSQKPHYWSLSDGTQPIKADSANIWVVSRETASESKNYFATEDFKEFHRLTNLYPEKEYNWLTAELVSWKQLDGTMSQGVLYKPENFDSTKKYPMLITYYNKHSHWLFQFPKPDFCTGDINIPWFVTHGYLVFTPDIHYKIASESGKTTGEWAYNSVVSAAQFLSKRLYIDKAKIGIEGHSFGGGQTNFIITHTNLFAAACEFAGDSDPTSGYLTLVPGFAPFEHFPKQNITEFGVGRMGASLWERPELYQNESAVLRADKITTPLLIVHNERDNNISWRQGLELYMALRRLGKKVWMLQYNDGHVLLIEKNAIDFTIRLTHFFDYYLKKQLPPKWMNENSPGSLVGIKNGYKFDNKHQR